MTERFIPSLPAVSSKPRFKLDASYTMRIDRAAQRWLYQYAARNLWRVSGWYDLDDLVQEGLLYWHKVVTHYRDTVTERPHMMRLFQTTYRNRIHALSLERTKRLSDETGKVVSEVPFLGDEEFSMKHSGRSRFDGGDRVSDNGEQAAEIEFNGLMANAPEPLRRLFVVLQKDDGPKRLRSIYRMYGDGTRETFNQRLASLIGWSGEAPNFRQMLADYLGD